MLGLGDMLRGERRQGAVYFIAGGLCQLSGCLGINSIDKIFWNFDILFSYVFDSVHEKGSYLGAFAETSSYECVRVI